MSKFSLIEARLIKTSVITTVQAEACGVSSTTMTNWAKAGKIERIARGVYSLPNQTYDTLYVMQLKCPKGIFSHETALMLHDLSDRTPSRLVMTVPAGYNTHRHSEDLVDFHYVKKDLHDLGVFEMASYYGNTIRVYDVERTICDVIKYRSRMDRAIVNTALKEYMLNPKTNKFKLSLYAKKMGITKMVSRVMEVLR